MKASIEMSNEIFKTGGIKNDSIEMVFSIEKRSERNYVPQFEPLLRGNFSWNLGQYWSDCPTWFHDIQRCHHLFRGTIC